MFIGELKTKGIFKIKIELAGAFKGIPAGKDQPEVASEPDLEAAWAGEWVLIREPTGDEVFQRAANGDGTANWSELLPICLVSWSLKRAENEPASKEEVLEALRASSTLWAYLLAEWGKALPLAKRNRPR